MNKTLKIKNISEGKSLNIIHKPMLTEKSTHLNQFNQYSFRVDLKATSLEIKNAIGIADTPKIIIKYLPTSG